VRTFIVERTRRTPLRFQGETVAEVATFPERGHPNFSGIEGAWEEASIYKTAKGRFVAAMCFRGHQLENGVFYDAEVCDSLSDAITWLSLRCPAKVVNLLISELPAEEVE